MKSDWIPVTKQTPNHGRDILVVLKDGTIMMGRYRISGGGFFSLYFSDTGLQYDDYMSRQVTHWMELPLQP